MYPHEERFQKWMDDRGAACTFVRGSRQWDAHIDFQGDGVFFDVKGVKEWSDVKLLFEWQAVRGRDGTEGRIGWGRGRAHWVVFERPDGKWLFVRREELLSLVSNVNWDAFTVRRPKDYPDLYTAYRRRELWSGDRDDIFCYVPLTDVLRLKSAKIL